MTDYLHSGANKMNKVGAYINDNKLLLADKLGHAKVSSLKEQNLLNTIATVQQHSNKITQLETDVNKVRGAYVYKGTVETEFDLPLNDNSVGDVYNTSSTGMNYARNGENWDTLGGTVSEGEENEELFQQIFTETLSSQSDDIEIRLTQTELGGIYQDVVVYVYFPGFDVNDEHCEQLWADFVCGENYVANIACPIKEAGSATGIATNACNLSFSIESHHGMPVITGTSFENDVSIRIPEFCYSGFFPGYTGTPIESYPSISLYGITDINLSLNQGSGSARFPAGTSITVFARKQVVEPSVMSP